jgi:hypothetical protein
MKQVALMWHGDRVARDTLNLAETRFGPTAEAFRAEGLEPVPCVYNDEFIVEVFDQLLDVRAVQVWVNPIMEGGGTREKLDDLLVEVWEEGVLVSSNPSAIRKMGTKDVLYDTRGMSWGSDVRLYASVDELRSGLRDSLHTGPRVLKQYRGHSGQGIWKITPTSDPALVLARHAPRGSPEDQVSLEDWVESCTHYFETGPMIDQEYNPRIAEGMIRCYFVRDRIEGFGHQAVNALVPGVDAGPRLYYPPDHPDFQDIRRLAETEWYPELVSLVNLYPYELPMLWDIDLMFGKNGGYTLCEINVSSVFPYPESAMRPLARAFKDALR